MKTVKTKKYVDGLFGEFRDAYTTLKGVGKGIASTSTIDRNDVALVCTEEDGMQLFLPESGEATDKGLALIEIYNAMCRDAAGIVDKRGRAIPENVPYQGFIKVHADKMKKRVDEN